MELDITQLTNGQVFDTYTELCRAVGCEPLQGNSKPKQLKEFARYFNYERDGRKYVITEVYNKPMSEEYRIAANAKYIGFVQNILLSYLSQQEEEIIYITPQKLWLLLGMVNDKYLTMKQPYRKQELLTLSEDMSMFDINHFFVRSNMKIRDILKSALGSLRRRKLLICEEVYRIGVIENDYKHFQSGIIYRDASDNEKKYILRIERKLLKELGFETDYQMLCSDKRTVYYDKLGQILRNEKGWENIYHCYKFIYDKGNIIEAINEDTEMKELNQLVIDALNEQAANNYKKKGYSADSAVLRMFDEDNPFFYYDGYQHRQQVLTEALIRR